MYSGVSFNFRTFWPQKQLYHSQYCCWLTCWNNCFVKLREEAKKSSWFIDLFFWLAWNKWIGLNSLCIYWSLYKRPLRGAVESCWKWLKMFPEETFWELYGVSFIWALHSSSCYSQIKEKANLRQVQLFTYESKGINDPNGLTAKL